MKNNLIITLLLVCWNVFPTFSQNKYVDSLQAVLNQSTTTSSEKFVIYNRLSEWYRMNEHYDRALAMIETHLTFAKKLKNEEEQVKALFNKGIVYNNMYAYEKNALVLDEAKKISSNSKNKVIKGYVHYLEAFLILSYGDYQEAIKSFQKVESILEPTQENVLKAKAFYNLYTIYSNFNDLPNTMLYAEKAVETAKYTDDKNLLCNTYSALAVAYTLAYDLRQQPGDLAKIFECSQKAVEVGETYKNQLGGITIAIVKLNLASYHLKYDSQNILLIKQKVHEALEASKAAAGNERVMANCYGMLSYLAQQENDWKTSEKYLLEAYQFLLNDPQPYNYSLIRITTDLANLYAKKGDFEKAYEYQKLETEYSLELYNEEQAAATKRLQAQFQLEKKEQALILAEERSERQRFQKWLYAGMVVITLVGSFFMFRSYHFRLKYSLQKESKLSVEKQEAELQVKLEKEEQQRLKAEQELLALKQQQLQGEVMASQLQLQHKNQVLHQLKEKLEDEIEVNIKQIIRDENLIDSDFDQLKFELQEVHPNFFSALNGAAIQKLTSLDVKYCAYIYLGMETKQIASLLNVEAKSVRMTKYRLKQKLGLNAETDLTQFLKGLAVG